MSKKIRKAIQHFLSAVVLWEVTTATGNSFHNLSPKTAFRIVFKIWLWIYGFIIFTKYKDTSLLCSWLRIKCFSSPETFNLKKLLQTQGSLFHLMLLPPHTLEKLCLCSAPPLKLLHAVPSKAQLCFCVWLVSVVSQEKEKATSSTDYSNCFLCYESSCPSLCSSCHLWHNGSFHSMGMVKS